MSRARTWRLTVDTQPSDGRRQGRRGCVGLLAAGLLLLVLGCAGSLLGIRGGTLTPRWFDERVGPVRIVGYTTWNANCPPFYGCDPTLQEAYVVWVMPDPGASAANRSPFQLLRLPIEHFE